MGSFVKEGRVVNASRDAMIDWIVGAANAQGADYTDRDVLEQISDEHLMVIALSLKVLPQEGDLFCLEEIAQESQDARIHLDGAQRTHRRGSSSSSRLR